MILRFVIVLLFVSSSLGCGESDATNVIAIFDAQSGIRADARRLVIEVGGRAPGEADFTLKESIEVPAPVPWPFRISLAPEEDDAGRQFRLVGTVSDDGTDGVIGRVEAISGYVGGSTRQLVLLFEDCCRGRGCEAGTTCRGCTCINPQIDPGTLQLFGDDPMISLDGGTGEPPDAGETPVDGGPNDSDADGYTDTEEGRFNMGGALDTDGDGIPDYEDRDSDNDWVDDADERMRGTNRAVADSDSDGAWDIVEDVVGTNPTMAGDNPDAMGITAILVPEGESPLPMSEVLEFETPRRELDVYFLLDITGSMGPALMAIQRDLRTGTFRAGCTGGIIGAITCVDRADRARFGVGVYADYPVNPYGDPRDAPYANRISITNDFAAIQSAIDFIGLGFGFDGPESQMAALHSTATGDGLDRFLMRRRGCPANTFGYPCFRDAAVRIVVIVTDALTHDGRAGANAYNDASLGFNSPDYDATVTALTDAQVRIIGFNHARTTFPRPDVTTELRRFARDTQSVDSAGRESVFELTGGDTLAASIVNGVDSQFELSVSGRVVDTDPMDGVDPDAAFVQRFRTHATTMPCTSGIMTRDRAMFGRAERDTFVDAPETATVCWELGIRSNTMVPQTADPQAFPAEAQYVDERLNEIGTRDLIFIVPPTIPNG